eukprot:jgi/Ulvmu1/37/UM001_0039.1
MASEPGFREFIVARTPPSYTLSAAINACRLQQHRYGGCIGFATEPSSWGLDVTLLYNRNSDGETIAYHADMDNDVHVYNIEGCLQPHVDLDQGVQTVPLIDIVGDQTSQQ